MSVKILVGDVRAMLATLPDESVNCIVTSPPYWALRDYGTATWEGGDADCEHVLVGTDRTAWANNVKGPNGGGKNGTQYANTTKEIGGHCAKCAAIRSDNQLGLEPTPQLHVAAMVDVFREVKRVLRKDGVCWVNYGDSYAGSINGRSAADTKAVGNDDRTFRDKPINNAAGGLKPKDLCPVPFRFALAMQDDGWWWRSCLPWVKRNGMPESITDRPASSVEYVFMFTKSARYWYDAAAVRQEAATEAEYKMPDNWDTGPGGHGSFHRQGREKGRSARDNFRREDSKRAAVNPGQAVGTHRPDRADSEYDLGSRNFRNSDLFFESLEGPHGLLTDGEGMPLALDVPPQPFRESHFATFPPKLIEPLIKAGCPVGGVVLDPFGGAFTASLVADRLQRNSIGIELNPAYVEIGIKRLRGDSSMFCEIEVQRGASAQTPGDAPACEMPASLAAGS